ncbi:hypothetical protein INR49_006600, partial [Caranx melampygus]
AVDLEAEKSKQSSVHQAAQQQHHQQHHQLQQQQLSLSVNRSLTQGQSEQQEQKVDDGWSQWRPELEQNIIMVLRVRGQEVRRSGGQDGLMTREDAGSEELRSVVLS